MTLDTAAIRRAARRTLGHQSLLPGQSEAIAAITDGRDTLALLPTGGGKSAIYQLAGEAIDGPTVVVSPLIALQQDQLDALIELGLSAAALNSAIPARERGAAIADFVARRIEFLVLAPEQLADNVPRRPAAGVPSCWATSGSRSSRRAGTATSVSRSTARRRPAQRRTWRAGDRTIRSF